MPNGDQQAVNQAEFVMVNVTDIGALERAQWLLLLEQVRLAIRRERRHPSSNLCAWCYGDAGSPFPAERSSGMCPYHFAQQMGRLEAKMRERLAEREGPAVAAEPM